MITFEKETKNPKPSPRSCCDIGVTLTVERFGHFRKDPKSNIAKPVKKFIWTNRNGMTVEAINYGATITSIKVPDKSGIINDVVLGFDDMEGYLDSINPYMGATIGRACNRISKGCMTIDGEQFDLSRNAPPNMLHGGFTGFDKILWSATKDEKKITLSYHSKDGEEGFPGGLNVNIILYLTDGNEFVMEHRAFTTKPTYVNITNHSYFNLAGHNAGSKELFNHNFFINGEAVLQVDKTSIPTGKLIPVGGTIFDFRIPKTLKDRFVKPDTKNGFDHNFCITQSEYQQNSFVARVTHPPSGRVLEIYSNQPGVQFYTANFFPEKIEIKKSKSDKISITEEKEIPADDKAASGEEQQTSEEKTDISINKIDDVSNKTDLEESIVADEAGEETGIPGKKFSRYYKHGAFALECQNYPDAINHADFPPAVLYPGKVYVHTLRYIFSVQEDGILKPKTTSIIPKL